MGEILQSACPDFFWIHDGVAIFLDANGKVTGVGSELPNGPPIPEELTQCVMNALGGLSFPCLGGYAVCPPMN